METLLLKIGGGAITDKDNNRREARRSVIQRIAQEISRAHAQKTFRLVVVHGAGPFGHKLVNDYAIKDGVRREKDIEGFIRTHNSMQDLNKIVMDIFRQKRLLGFPLQPSAWIIQHQKQIVTCFPEVIQGLLALNPMIIPILYGDMVLDRSLGASVVSGDALIAKLVQLLAPDRVLMGTDVAGIFTADPKKHPDARLIPCVGLDNLQTVLESSKQASTIDVTGGMLGKLNELLQACQRTPGLIFDITEPEALYRALLGHAIRGTELRL
jgi:isopentenyl phosphate kinase